MIFLVDTIIAVEDKRQIHWAKPEDINIDAESGFPKLRGVHDGGFFVAFADGSTSFVRDKVDRKHLWKFYTAKGGEAVDHNSLNPK